MQAVLEEPPAVEGAYPAPNLDEVSSPVKPVEKESAAVAKDIVQPAQEEDPVLAWTVPKGTGDLTVGGGQASRPALLLALAARSPAQGVASSSALEGREGVSFPELYTGVMARLDQQRDFLAKMKQEYEVFLLLLV